MERQDVAEVVPLIPPASSARARARVQHIFDASQSIIDAADRGAPECASLPALSEDHALIPAPALASALASSSAPTPPPLVHHYTLASDHGPTPDGSEDDFLAIDHEVSPYDVVSTSPSSASAGVTSAVPGT